MTLSPPTTFYWLFYFHAGQFDWVILDPYPRQGWGKPHGNEVVANLNVCCINADTSKDIGNRLGQDKTVFLGREPPPPRTLYTISLHPFCTKHWLETKISEVACICVFVMVWTGCDLAFFSDRNLYSGVTFQTDTEDQNSVYFSNINMHFCPFLFTQCPARLAVTRGDILDPTVSLIYVLSPLMTGVLTNVSFFFSSRRHNGWRAWKVRQCPAWSRRKRGRKDDVIWILLVRRRWMSDVTQFDVPVTRCVQHVPESIANSVQAPIGWRGAWPPCSILKLFHLKKKNNTSNPEFHGETNEKKLTRTGRNETKPQWCIYTIAKGQT